MTQRFFLISILAPFISFGQIQDNFSDGNFTLNPIWNGNTNEFIVNTSHELQINNTIANTSYLSTTNSLMSLNDLEWKFSIRLAFSPSGTNNCRLYLSSNVPDLKKAVNGYFLQFGEAGSLDAIQLFRQDSLAITSILRGTNTSIASAFNLEVKVSRDSAGLWKLFTKPSLIQNKFELEASGIDTNINSCAYFGVICNYSISNASKFFFDNFYCGPPLIDTIITEHNPKPYDIVINEIMADPSPSHGLPELEYIELFNTSHFDVNLNNYLLTSGSHNRSIGNVFILADSFLLLTSPAGVLAFDPYIAKTGITNFPVLTNTGQSISLKSSNGLVISSITYSNKWYQNENKKKGGWSLEQIDPLNPCAGISNWGASENHSGGSPGKKNSIFGNNPDQTSPELLRVSVLAADTLEIYFNETLDITSIFDSSIYNIGPGIGHPKKISAIAPDYHKLILTLEIPLQQEIIYTIGLDKIVCDCKGNKINKLNTADFALPQAANPSEIVINEILFDPNNGGVDFVEIYNKSTKFIDVKSIFLSSFDSVNNKLASLCPISNENYLFLPGQYLVLSVNSNMVKNQYYTNNQNGFIDLPNMPSMNVSDGQVVLSDTAGMIIDFLSYSAKMHFPLLSQTKGVSLERIDFNRQTQDKTNWHSASANIGFASPAYTNSQHHHSSESNQGLAISPKIFSPDNDGYNDVINIHYSFDTPGLTANITIYDASGRRIKSLVKNELIGTMGEYSWDGINENNERAATGIYIIYFAVFSVNGDINHFKETCVLAKKL